MIIPPTWNEENTHCTIDSQNPATTYDVYKWNPANECESLQ